MTDRSASEIAAEARSSTSRDRLSQVALDGFWTLLVERHGDLDALLRTIADRVVDLLGDGCVLSTVAPDGNELEPRVVVHVDPDVSYAMRGVLGASNVRIGEGIAGHVAADRRAVLLNHLRPETVADTTPERFLPFLRDHPMRSLMIVPLLAAGELMGTLGAVRTSSDEPYTAADLRLLEALAERAALAIAAAVTSPRSVGAADFEAI
jgi:GAF domain-containing protein